jgi:hypothetical protein
VVAVAVVVALGRRRRRLRRRAGRGGGGGCCERDRLLVRLGVPHVPHQRLFTRRRDAKNHATRVLKRGGGCALQVGRVAGGRAAAAGPRGGPGPLGARGVQDVRDPLVARRHGEHRARRRRGLTHAPRRLGRGELALRERDARDAPHPAAVQVLGAGAHDADELGALLVALPVEPAQVVFVFVLQAPPKDREERARGREVPPVARGELHHGPRRRRMRAERLVVALLQLHHQARDVLSVHGRRVRERRAQAQRDPLQLAQVLVALLSRGGERGHTGGGGRGGAG